MWDVLDSILKRFRQNATLPEPMAQQPGQGHCYSRLYPVGDRQCDQRMMVRVLGWGDYSPAKLDEIRARQAREAQEAQEAAARMAAGMAAIDALLIRWKAEIEAEMAANAARPRPDLRGKRIWIVRRRANHGGPSHAEDQYRDDDICLSPEELAIVLRPRHPPRNDWPREPFQSPE